MLLDPRDIVDADRRQALLRRRLHRIAGDGGQCLGHGIRRFLAFLCLARLFRILGGKLCLGKVLQHAAGGLFTLFLILHQLVQLVRHSVIRLRGMNFLASIGSVSPFVGLFGTVWGIMNSFQSIAESKNTSLAVVAPGIAEALFATALGLAAAIPAVIAYNKFAGDLDRVGGRLETFAQEFSTLLARQLDEGGR